MSREEREREFRKEEVTKKEDKSYDWIHGL